MKTNTMTLLKLPAAFQHLPAIKSLLNGLGASDQEMRQLWRCFLRRKSTGGSHCRPRNKRLACLETNNNNDA
jgi:hypothetical protein